MSRGSSRSRGSIFKFNYLQELPEDIKILIYNHVYKDNYSIVLKEFIANLSNLKHYNNLRHFLVYQEEPKLNLLHFLSQHIYINGSCNSRNMQNSHNSQNTRNSRNIRNTHRGPEDSILSLYKRHLTSNNLAKTNISKIRIIRLPANIFKYLDKIIAKTFANFLNKSTNNWARSSRIYVDDLGEYFVLEYERCFLCFADLYLILLSFWIFIRIKLYEFYELHKEAYNLYITNLLKNDYDTGLYIWFGGNITDVGDNILINNLVKMKNENASLYRKIIRQRRNINNSECLYINFEIRNNIDGYIIKDDAIIMRLKEI